MARSLMRGEQRAWGFDDSNCRKRVRSERSDKRIQEGLSRVPDVEDSFRVREIVLL